MPHALLLKFPGTNCDAETARALEAAGFTAEVMPVALLEPAALDKAQMIVFSGGFSYGDYVMSGRIAQLITKSKLGDRLKTFVANGGYALGICNGFQILTETGLLPGVLMRNRNLKFICKDVYLRVENAGTDFTAKHKLGDVVRYPIAHAEGNYFVEPETFRAMEGQGQVAFRYCSKSGEVSDAVNPNGALSNVAGVYNDKKTVLGLMPHPERLAEDLLGGKDGKAMFDSLVEALS